MRKKGGTVSVVGGERKKAGERGKKGGTLSVVGGERKKAVERGKKGGTLSVVGGERKKARKKRGDSLGSWGERGKKKGGLSR